MRALSSSTADRPVRPTATVTGIRQQSCCQRHLAVRWSVTRAAGLPQARAPSWRGRHMPKWPDPAEAPHSSDIVRRRTPAQLARHHAAGRQVTHNMNRRRCDERFKILSVALSAEVDWGGQERPRMQRGTRTEWGFGGVFGASRRPLEKQRRPSRQAATWHDLYTQLG